MRFAPCIIFFPKVRIESQIGIGVRQGMLLLPRGVVCEHTERFGMRYSRRDFIRLGAVGAGWACLKTAGAEDVHRDMPYRTLGKTGEKVSLLCLGGFHIGESSVDDDLAIRLMHHAVDEGVNFFDNAHDYHGGRSETLMGRALKNGYRDRVFLMTKVKGRDASTVTRELEACLRRLEVDHVDLMQVHEVVHPDHPRQVYENGVLEVLVKAREAGRIRYIGVTGHSYPEFLNEMIDRGFAWDTIQLPLNVFDAHFRSFQRKTLPKAVQHNLGVIAMKTMGGTPAAIPASGAVSHEDCLRYAMNLPVASVCSGVISMEMLKANIRTTKSFVPLTEAERDRLLKQSETPALTGAHEPYKTQWHRDVIRLMEEKSEA